MSSTLPFSIVAVRSADDLAGTVNLFRTYAQSLGIDLSFQNFEAEMAAMPGKYAPPTGELLLARNADGEPVGCVGLRSLGPPTARCCEMKRLYTSPAVRGLGLGSALINAILDVARNLEYEQIKLDTLRSMETAIRLYKKAGFAETEAYYDTPLADTVFLACSLKNPH